MPKVSVIVPVYGVEKYIERCARSLFDQTLDDMEFIFIDDCTPDQSINILHKVLLDYPLRLPQTRIERMPQNSGLAAVRKYGVSIASGDYFIACDSDDFVEKEMYEVMYVSAVERDYDLVQCDIDVVGDNGLIRSYTSDINNPSSDTFRIMIMEGRVSNSLCNKLVKKEVYLDGRIVFPQYGMDEDNTMSVQLAYCSKQIGYVKKPFYKAYCNIFSISRQPGKEQVLKRYNESYANSQIVVDFLNKQGYSNSNMAIVVAKLRPKYVLWPILTIRLIKLWHQTYPEVNTFSLLNKRVSFRAKLKVFLADSYLIPLYNTIKELRNK
jgi:glycosyltransferase involved in cell wall biosynthesis